MGLMCTFGIVISVVVVVVVVVVVGGGVVWTTSSSSKSTCVGEVLIQIDLCYLYPSLIICCCVSLILCKSCHDLCNENVRFN